MDEKKEDSTTTAPSTPKKQSPRKNGVTDTPTCVTTTAIDQEIQVTGGDALDVISGPPRDVMTWRNFAQLCRAVEQESEAETTKTCDDGAATTSQETRCQRLREKANAMTELAMQLKVILNKLEESYQSGFAKIPLTPKMPSSS